MKTTVKFEAALRSLRQPQTPEQMEKTRKQIFRLQDKLLQEANAAKQKTRRDTEQARREAAARKRQIKADAHKHRVFMDRTLQEVQNRFLEAEKLKRKT